MIGIFGDQQIRDCCFGWNPALDQMSRCRGLPHTIAAVTAGILRAARDDDADPRGGNVQHLRYILPDAIQESATDTDQASRLETSFETRIHKGRASCGEKVRPT